MSATWMRSFIANTIVSLTSVIALSVCHCHEHGDPDLTHQTRLLHHPDQIQLYTFPSIFQCQAAVVHILLCLWH